MRFENAEFKLTKLILIIEIIIFLFFNREMINIMGGSYETESFRFYEDLVIKAFLEVRKYRKHIINVITPMYYSGLKCFWKDSLIVHIYI